MFATTNYVSFLTTPQMCFSVNLEGIEKLSEIIAD